MKQVYCIAKKEIIELFRSGTLLTVLLISVLIFPIVGIGLNLMNNSSDTISFSLMGQSAGEEFSGFIKSSDRNNFSVVSLQDPIQGLKDNEIDFIVISDDTDITFLYNSNSLLSFFRTTSVCEQFSEYYYKSLSKQDSDFLNISCIDEKKSESMLDSLSLPIIQLVLLTVLFQSSSFMVVELFAGEKEKRTLELLFLTQIDRKKIYFGKISAFLLFSFAGQSITLLSFFIFNHFSSFDFLPKSLGSGQIFVLICVFFFLAFLSAIFNTSVSLFSPNRRIAQFLCEIVSVVPIAFGILVISGIVNSKTAVLNYIPLLNAELLLLETFSSSAELNNFIIVVITNSILAAVVIVSGIRYLYSEKALLSNG